MKRNYTTVGTQEASHEMVDKAINTLDWLEVDKITSLPMAQGMAIKEAVKQFKIPKISHVAIHGRITVEHNQTYGFYGIKAHYKNGDAIIYLLDNGCEVIPMASDFLTGKE